MKFLLFLAIPFFGLSQARDPKTLVGVGIQAGYSSVKTIVGEGYIAVKLKEDTLTLPVIHTKIPGAVVIYPLSIKVHGSRDISTPVIWETRIGYKLNQFELYAGYGLHLAGQDGRKEYDCYKGFYPGCGIIYHPLKKIILTAGLSRFDRHKIFTVQVGIFDFGKLK